MDNTNKKVNKLNTPITSNKSGAVLAKLWVTILTDLGLDSSLPFLIDRHIATIKSSQNKKRVARTPIINNATAKEMTWKVFLGLIFNLIKTVKKITITVELHHKNGTSTIHSTECMYISNEKEVNDEVD